MNAPAALAALLLSAPVSWASDAPPDLPEGHLSIEQVFEPFGPGAVVECSDAYGHARYKDKTWTLAGRATPEANLSVPMSSLHLLRRLAAVNGKGERKLLETIAFALHHDRGDAGFVVCGIISPADL